ncbi:nucleoside-diphosphate-sugar epimerase [Paraburkholderia sp. GAS41]|jgi:nucleoside-diphosphate-sugar epimerase|uniref:NAD-dependent epimerase/dehydratase family protein n=1 Tax=Paraburkholderia sp. GAS41 TaxID=3035134 RepID=UPI003D1EBE6D
MTILVTGATSGLGRNAAAFLAQQGSNVRATGRNRAAGESLQAPGMAFVPLDLASAANTELDSLLHGVDTVWHCAALSSPWGAWSDFHAANVLATTRLAQTAVTHGVRRFVHISTPSLYFDFNHRLDIEETFRPARYVNHYASTKAQAEDVIREVAATHPDTTFVMLRPRGIFGPHDRVLLPRILRLLRERSGQLPLPRAGTARLDLTYVGNVVHAMHLATTCADVRSGEAFNITNDEPTCLRDVLDALLTRLGIAYRIKDVPYSVLDLAARAMQHWAALSGREPLLTRYSVGALNFDMTLSTRKAQTVLGYRPRWTLQQSIEETVNWIRAHGDDYGL